jgi:GTP cyclohydrolase I
MSDNLETFRDVLSELTESVASLSDAVRAILKTSGPDIAREHLKEADVCLLKAIDALWPTGE